MSAGGPHLRGHGNHAGAPLRDSARPALLALLALTAALCGCSANEPFNPSFPLRLDDAKRELRDMAETPVPFDRPVVVTGGIYDPGFVAGGIARHLRKVHGEGAPVMTVSFLGVGSFDRCRERLVEAVQERYPCDDPHATVEVDVVGFSMGGLVARHAAREDGVGRRLRISRLFTIATPHRGARIAHLPTFDGRVRDMRSGAAFLDGLEAELERADYEIQAYTRLGDTVVGVENAAPPGIVPWWVANDPFSFAHLGAGDDERIVADIARRLRGERPFTIEPPLPPPGWEEAEPIEGEEAIAGPALD